MFLDRMEAGPGPARTARGTGAFALAPACGRFLQVDPVGYKDQANLYAYVANDPLNGTDPSGERCKSQDGTTVCVPEDRSLPSFSFPTPEGWEDFDPSHPNFHSYPSDWAAGEGDETYGALLSDELARHPTPGEGTASPNGTRIDVDIPGPFGADHVKSYLKSDAAGSPFIVNVTEPDHTLHSGFVIRQVVPDGNGGYTVRTYGEGNSWKQTGALRGLAENREKVTWRGNVRLIVAHARARRAGQ